MHDSSIDLVSRISHSVVTMVVVGGGVTSSEPIGGCGIDVITARRTRSSVDVCMSFFTLTLAFIVFASWSIPSHFSTKQNHSV